MTLPFDRLPPPKRKAACIALGAASVALMAVLAWIGQPISTRLAGGILDLEMPWHAAGARQVLAELGEEGIAAARLHTWVDFGFIAVYAPALALAARWMAARQVPWLERFSPGAAWAPLLAGGCDAGENLGLLLLLAGTTAAPLPQIVSMLAVVKFTLLALAGIYVIVEALSGVGALGWWIGKALVLVRIHAFTLVSLAIGLYFFGFSQPARELWEELLAFGHPAQALFTLIAALAWLWALAWSPLHAQRFFLADERIEHGAEWPRAAVERDHRRMHAALDRIPAAAPLAGAAALLFGAVSNGIAESDKANLLLSVAVVAACSVGIVSQRRWVAMAAEQRRARSRRLMFWQAAWGVFLALLVVRVVPDGGGPRYALTVVLPTLAPALLAMASSWALGGRAALAARTVWALGAGRALISLVIVLASFECAEQVSALAAVGISAAVLLLEALYHALHARAARLNRLRESGAAKWLAPAHAPRAGLLVPLTVVVPCVAFALAPVALGWALGTLAIVLLALAAWTATATVLFVTVPLRLGLGAAPLALPVWLLVVSPLTDNHALPHTAAYLPWRAGAQAAVPLDAPPLRRYDLRLAEDFAHWRTSGARVAAEDAPVVIVSASGGGIRAAYWTALVLAQLDDRSCGAFARQLYAISGVSGGSVGAAVFVAAVHHLGERRGCAEGDAPGAAEQIVRRFFEHDLMAPIVGSMLLPDALQRALPAIIPWGDRGRALERSIEEAWRRAVPGSDTLAEPMQSLYEADSERRLPLLVFNSTNVADGARVAAAPVQLPDRLAYPLFSYQLRTNGMRLSTAAHNSARFPMVSPPASVLTREGRLALRIVDGGYFENSAAASATALHRAVRALAGPTQPVASLLIENDPELDAPTANCDADAERLAAQQPLGDFDDRISRNPVPLPEQSPPVSNLAFELDSITHALLAARSARSPWHQQENANLVCDDSRNLVRAAFFGDDQGTAADGQRTAARKPPDPALSWALSSKTRSRMERQAALAAQRQWVGRFAQWR